MAGNINQELRDAHERWCYGSCPTLFSKAADEIEMLRAIVMSKLHQRRCYDCKHVFWAADSITPYCLCEKCKSQDTRRMTTVW